MNRWDKKYSGEEYLFGTEGNEFIRQHAVSYFSSNTNIAAYAEGEGRNACYLASQGFYVTAYDYSEKGLEKAHALAKKKGVSFHTKLVDLENEELPYEIYDGAILVFGHFSKTYQLPILNKIMDSLKPNCYFLLEVYEEGQVNLNTGGPNNVEHLYNAFDILTWAKQYEIKHFFSGEVERNEGFRHTGTCRVVQLIIKK